VASLRIGYVSPSDSANRALAPTESTLAAKWLTFIRCNSSPNALSDLHSAVQPPVNAFGNQATTKGRPARSFRRYVLPSDPGREKSGAGSPGFSSTGVGGDCVTRLK